MRGKRFDALPRPGSTAPASKEKPAPRRRGLISSPRHLTNFVEPPGADPHARWCGEGGQKWPPLPDSIAQTLPAKAGGKYKLNPAGKIINGAPLRGGEERPVAEWSPLCDRRQQRNWFVMQTLHR
jgi:hypothetical protein